MKPLVAPAFTYPTPRMQIIIDDIREDIRLMRQWYGVESGATSKGVIAEVTPASVLDTLETVVESVEPALRFYLNYPSQRLCIFLKHFVDEADRFVSWLSIYDSEYRDPALSREQYQHAADRLQASLRDWHNSLVLTGIEHELDMDTPEVQH
jgi:hypothetical protein